MKIELFQFTPSNGLAESKASFLIDGKTFFVYGVETATPTCYTGSSKRAINGAMDRITNSGEAQKLCEIVKTKIA